MQAALRLENFSYAWPGAEHDTLRQVSLEVPPGECHCLTGATGSGKTTLALALKGLLPAGRQSGRLQLPDAAGGESCGVGLVLQNPETQLLAETVGAEVAFGLENLCLPPAEMPGRVEAALAAVGLPLPFDHPTGRLSMGQKYRLLIAAQLVMNPALLVLDEPGGQLDPAGLLSLAAVLAGLKREGVAVLLCEHRPAPLASTIDRYWQLLPGGELRPGAGAPAAEPPRARRSPGGRPSGAPVVQARELGVDARDAAPAWQGATLTLEQGELALLSAPNGTGKTTLLRCLAGFIRPRQGEIRIFGEPPEPRRLRGRVGFLFQNPRRQLFETTVFEEVSFSLRRLGPSRDSQAGQVRRALERCGIAHLAGCSPHQLSYGQKHLVALAAILAAGPQLLLLDDPFAGLDGAYVARVAEALVAQSEEQGTTLLWTSHDDECGPAWAHRTLTIEGGCIVPL